MPETQRTIEEQAARNRRGQQLLDRRRALTGDPYRKLLLLILDDHIGPGASFALSFAHLANETEMHESTVRRKAAELREMGLIDYEETASGSSVYEFRIVRSNVSELADDSGPSPRKRRRGRPKKSLQPANDFCTPQKDFAGSENNLHTAKTFRTPQNAPYIERPFNDHLTNPITHAPPERTVQANARTDSAPSKKMDGDGVLKNDFGGWDRPIETWQLSDKAHVQTRYLEAVRKGWITSSEQNQIHFFALSRYCGKAKVVRKPGSAFTFYLKQQKWSVIRCEDIDAATKAIASMRSPVSAYASAVSFAEIPE